MSYWSIGQQLTPMEKIIWHDHLVEAVSSKLSLVAIWNTKEVFD